MPPTEEQVLAGQAVYTKRTLSWYDLLVLGLSNRLIWRCPTSQILKHYNAHVTSNHLDVGVGTGYFPDRCRFPTESPRVALMDLNPNTLEYASRRIARYKPEIYRQNILEPIETPMERFDSVGINYLLHCLPGAIAEKSIVFDHLAAVMNPGACLFGSTILQRGVRRNWLARRLMSVYNRKGIFTNTGDDLEGLTTALQQRFEDVKVEVVGCVALFVGREPGGESP